MNLKLTVSIALLFILYSCAEIKNIVNQTTFEIPYESHKNNVLLSTYFKSIAFLPLQTNKESLIGSIKKLKIINKKIYIYDNIGNSILIFNDNGQFEKKISSIGGGPGEYISISDFDVEDDNLYIMDISGKILHFKNDIYVDSKRIDFRATDFCITKGGFIFKNLDFKKEYNQFVVTSKDLKNKKEILPLSNLNSKEFKFNWGGSNNFVTNNSKTFFSPNYSKYIYELDSENFTIKHTNMLDFGDKNLPDNDSVNNYNIVDPNFEYIVRRNFFVHKNYIILDFLYDDLLCIDWIDTNTEIHNIGIAKNDINKIPFIPSWGFDNGLVGSMSASQIINGLNFIDNNSKLKDIKISDNPVLMIYKYKDL